MVRLSRAKYVGVLMPNGPTSDDASVNSNDRATPSGVKSTVVHCEITYGWATEDGTR